MTEVNQKSDPIAICGIGCRMPGGVRDMPGLWDFLKDQRDVHMEFAEPRFPAKGYYHPNNDRPGTAVASHGFLLEEDPLLFDASFFGITDAEVETLDAAQRKLLECTYEAFENAGDTLESISGSKTGVFVGDICFDNYVTQTRDWEYGGKYSATGSFPNMLANRLHYVFNLKGPSLLINSACTSAMYALHLAIQAMRNGDCDTAIVAGSNWIMDPNCHIAMGKLGALSATSRSHTFDASADGYARGEGFAALYLKKASKAMEDASPIRALISGTAVNANGRTKGITNPSGPAQQVLITEAYKNAGLDPSETAFLECHGTGTRVGDPTEVAAAGAVFGPGRSDKVEDRLLVGSVKTNMGHLEGACALPGILKVVAALEHELIPPTLGYKNPNPRIDFEKSKVRVNSELEQWPKNKLKRASVTSAGFGGTNGHCIIDHVQNVLPEYTKPGFVQPRFEEISERAANGQVNGYTNGHTNGYTNGHTEELEALSKHSPGLQSPTKTRSANAETRPYVVLPFSGHSKESLKSNVHALSPVLNQDNIADVAYTLAAKRTRFIHRAFNIVDTSLPELTLGEDVSITTSPQPTRLGFVFTGQGAQWHAMGAELFEYAVFRNTISYLDHVLSLLPNPAPWKLSDILSGACEKDLVQVAAVSQTVCTALQIGLVDLLASWSVRPAGVVGHSSGEMAAAYASGYVTSAEAITAAYYRGYMVSFNKENGAMVAVGVGVEKGEEYIHAAGLQEKIRVAAINSPDSITVSGDAEAIEKLAAKLTDDGVFNRVLKTGGLAYHSHHMLALGNGYAEAIDAGEQKLDASGINASNQKYSYAPWFSSVTPGKDMGLPDKKLSTSYWRSNLESPVRFSEALSKLLSSEEANVGAIIEIGPHPALKSPATQIAKSLGKTIPHVGTVKRNENGQRALAEFAGNLFALNAEVDIVAVNGIDGSDGDIIHGCTAVDLPPYQFTYGPILYHETRASKEFRLRSVPRHDLLGSKIPGTTLLRPQWRNMIKLKDLPWLDDHRVPPHVLHPGAAHIVMAMLAAEHAYNDFPGALPVVGVTLRNVSIKKTLVVPEDDKGIELVISMELEDGSSAKSPGWATFSISSVVADTNQWTEHCSGMSKVDVASFDEIAVMDTTMDGRAVDAEVWYKRFAAMGLQFGPSFQGYSEIQADPAKNVAVAQLELNTTKNLFPNGGESEYPIHPASLDLLIRLGLMACNGGQAETAAVQLPIHLDQLRYKLGNLGDRKSATGIAKGELRGLRAAYSELQLLGEAGDVILDINNMRFIDLANEVSASSASAQAGKAYSSPYNRLVWRPDVRTLNEQQILATLAASKHKDHMVPELTELIDLLGHAIPNQKILQLGVEDQGISQGILKTLVGSNGLKQYREYTLTDISEEAIAEKTSEFRDVRYSALDIERDPTEQGLQADYDVVISLNTIQSASDHQKVLENSAKLMRIGGKLILVGTHKILPEVFGRAGFSLDAGTQLGDQKSALAIATRRAVTHDVDRRSPVIQILHGKQGPPTFYPDLAKAFEQRGQTVKAASFDSAKEVVEPQSRVIAFLDNENLLLGKTDQERISLFQHLAANASSMIWLTSSGFAKGKNPEGAFVSGLLRTLGSENPAGHFLSIDIDAEKFNVSEHETEDLVRSIVDQESTLHEESGDDGVNRELVWQDGSLWVSRIVPDGELQGYNDVTSAPDDNDTDLVPITTDTPIRAAFGQAGILTSLYFKPYLDIYTSLPRDFIEVKVLAVGLNWKDLGLSTGRFDQNNLSNEYVGIVTKRGSDITHVEVGERVYGMGKGHFGNYTRVPGVLARPVPKEADTMQAATMPLIYMTAVYAFEHVTRLRKGQKVLIQSASGGLGLAAIQLARSKGAEIFVTAGTPGKTSFLIEKMGIPASHVFSSRDPKDIARLVKATEHGGFDVILSNSQGPMLYESIKALAPLGHLIDVGRLDVTSSKSIGLELFQKSASFTSFDLGLVIERDVNFGGELMQAVDEHFKAGRIGPIDPLIATDISELAQALLSFSKGTHIGKMVVSYENPKSMVKMRKSVVPAHFDANAQYILVGGLSGLGRSLVRYFSDRGARNITVWSRSGAKNLNAESKTLIDSMTAKGVNVNVVACDVSDREQVKKYMAEASSKMPVRGVLHYAVSYQDISFNKMTAQMFHDGMAAKVLGVQNLHNATLDTPLDFFSMVSSFGTVYAFPTQSTYLAANNYLDYFARYRRRLGLPATTVSLGFISDLGSLTQDAVTVNLFTRTKGQTVTAHQVLRMLEPSFVNGNATNWLGHAADPLSEANIVTGVDPAVLAHMKREEMSSGKGNSDSVSSGPRWYRDARVSLMLRGMDDAYRHQSGNDAAKMMEEDSSAGQSRTARLRHQFQVLIAKSKDQSEDKTQVQKDMFDFVTESIRTTVADLLFIDPSVVKVSDTVSEHGIDSLLAAEFRNWFYAVFAQNISMLDLMNPKTKIDGLSKKVCDVAVSK